MSHAISTAVAPAGIDAAAVTAWFAGHVSAARPPLAFSLIEAGHSNMTFVVSDVHEQRWVLRRPPLHNVLATAHDMGREHRAIAALHPVGFPVPRPLGLCTDPDVNGAPFYVMEYVDGVVVRDAGEAAGLPVAARRVVSHSLVDVLARLHGIDIDAVGLGDLGRREGYVARQLRRWLRQVESTPGADRPEIRAVHDHLAGRIPEQSTTGIVHGDYRLDNCIVNRDGNVLAVLDWELCTLGDVLADVAMLLTYWSEPGDEAQALDNAPTAVEGFSSRAELLQAYAEASGRSVERIDFYLAWGAWRLACILVGVQARYLAGAMGDKAPLEGIESFSGRIDGLMARAAHHAARVP